MCYMGRLTRVGVRDLRQNLSVYLRRIGDGEIFEVTERGRPVAVLRPLAAADDPISRVEAEGRIFRRATGDPRKLPRPLPAGKGKPLSEILDEQREDRV